MEQVPPQYLHIAVDLSDRIAKGELKEGSRIYGRSVMASEYNVSPETIRRALRLLADMKVVETKPQSGTCVISADNARKYLEAFDGSAETSSLCRQLVKQIAEAKEMYRRIQDTASALLKNRSTFTVANEPLANYELPIGDDSPVIGKSIGELNFWQCTGATIVAIRRGQTAIVSPGPYAEISSGDVLILVGNTSAIEAADRLIGKEDFFDTV